MIRVLRERLSASDEELISEARVALAHAWCEAHELRRNEDMPEQLLGHLLNICYAIESADKNLELVQDEPE